MVGSGTASAYKQLRSMVKVAKKRRKVHKVMGEFKRGGLNIGKSKKKVKLRKQAIAIALSEAGLSRKDKRRSGRRGRRRK